MTTLHETAYPSLRPDPTPRELAELYTPSAEEQRLACDIGKRALLRMAALIHLKVFQRLGYFIPLTEVPQVIREHIALQAGVIRPPLMADLKRVEASGARSALFMALRRHLNVRPLDPAGHDWLAVVADAAAETKHAVADIINVMLEELVHHRYELPAFSTLDRMAFRAREKSNNQYFSAIAGQLTAQTRALIDGLLKTSTGESVSPWQMLKREPKRPTNKETRTYIQHIRRLQHLVEQLPKPDVPVPKLKQFRLLARALNATEMAELMHAVKDDLKSGDLFIKYGERYDDYREQLVDDETYEKEVGDYGQVTGIETDPSVFVSKLKSALSQRAKEIDANFPENAHAEIVDGRLILSKPPRSDIVEAAARIDGMITERMKAASIVDLMIDTERWLDLHKLFRPLAGTDSRLEDLRMRVITTLFCYGCNLGPVQTAKSIKGLSRRQISWLNLKYVSEDLLDSAIVKVINAYNKFELPGYWGTGKHASADGTKWNLYEQNLLSEHHIRYGGYGGIGYYHVSDKFIALFSHFISCGTYEGIHILDGLMSNESDIRPDTIHGDTQAQSYPVFALAHLLGIQLMPRIRGIQDLKFHRPESSAAYQNINALFSDVIDWALIELHLPAMLRVAVSIKTGKITPSAILRRLGTYSRKNKLYFAFVELGKVIRTMFLLSYIGDVGLRKVIHAETNKSEQFNGFAGWSFFGGEGIIAENIRHEQRKVIKYNHLVANMIILHNVVGMTRVLRELRDEGTEITPEILGGLAPFRTAHINRFGDYTLDFRRKIGPLDFDVSIFPMKS